MDYYNAILWTLVYIYISPRPFLVDIILIDIIVWALTVCFKLVNYALEWLYVGYQNYFDSEMMNYYYLNKRKNELKTNISELKKKIYELDTKNKKLEKELVETLNKLEQD